RSNGSEPINASMTSSSTRNLSWNTTKRPRSTEQASHQRFRLHAGRARRHMLPVALRLRTEQLVDLGLETRQERGREQIASPNEAGIAISLALEPVDLDPVGVEIHEPVFGDPMPFVELALATEVDPCRAGRGHLHDEIEVPDRARDRGVEVIR